MILVYILSAVILAVSLILQSHPSFDAIRFAGVKPDLHLSQSFIFRILSVHFTVRHVPSLPVFFRMLIQTARLD